MSHNHPVLDTDNLFVIDPLTRVIKAQSSKTSVVQYDHNSERFSFELPRYIEGHDMTACNKVEVHYLNAGQGKDEKASGVYAVDDLQEVEGEDKVTCSWLISAGATQYAGKLAFLLRFCCLEDETVTYAWNTAPYERIHVTEGMNASATVVLDYSDILEKWKASLFAAGYINAETMQQDIKNLREDLELRTTYVTPQMFGAKADGVTDDTAAINACLAAHPRVYIPEGVYIVDPEVSLIMQSNQVLELSENAVLKAFVTDESKYNYLLTIQDVENVTVRGGKLCGDRNEYPDSTAERGYGIFIRNSRNVVVEGCEIADFRGDCILIESYAASAAEYESVVSSNVQVRRCSIHNALRHGITVMGVQSMVVKDTDIFATNGKSYSCAIDAETHYEWQAMSDFRYENVRAYNCGSGVMFNENSFTGTIECVSVKNCSLYRLQLSIAGAASVDRSSIDTVSVGGIDHFVATHCVLGSFGVPHTAKRVTLNKCVFNCDEYRPEAITFRYSAEASSVDCEVNDCVFNSYVSDVKDVAKSIFNIQCLPHNLTFNGCTVYSNNPNAVRLYAENVLKVFGCRFIYRFNQEGYPSALVSVGAAQSFIVGNVFDTTQAHATKNTACVMEGSLGDVFFIGNIGVMLEKYGAQMTVSSGESGRTWTFMNNVFPLYPGKGQTVAGVTYVDVSNIYSGTT